MRTFWILYFKYTEGNFGTSVLAFNIHFRFQHSLCLIIQMQIIGNLEAATNLNIKGSHEIGLSEVALWNRISNLHDNWNCLPFFKALIGLQNKDKGNHNL